MTILQQWQTAKEASPGTIVIMKMGDFYEAFGDDARIVSRTLGLTLTTRRVQGDDALPMTGFPYHQLDGYLAKLIKHGHRVAVQP